MLNRVWSAVAQLSSSIYCMCIGHKLYTVEVFNHKEQAVLCTICRREYMWVNYGSPHQPILTKTSLNMEDQS